MALDHKQNKVCLGSFNFIKGIAICIVMLGHIALDFDTGRLTWFYPLFMALSFLKTPFIPLFFIIFLVLLLTLFVGVPLSDDFLNFF